MSNPSKRKMYAYVVTVVNFRFNGDSESHQHEFSTKPTKKQIEKFLQKLYPDEFDDNECYTNWGIKKIKILDIKNYDRT